MPKFSKVITQKIFFFPEFIQKLIKSSTHLYYQSIYQVSRLKAPTVFEILLTREKCSKLQRAIAHELFCKIYLKVNQAVYSSIPVDSSGLIVFQLFC